VSDESHQRVTKYTKCSARITSNEASVVLGQKNLTACNQTGASLSEMNYPSGVYVNSNGTLWVSDLANNRILGFKDSASAKNGQKADLQLGLGGDENGCTSDQLNNPFGITGDLSGNLWVVDSWNHRIAVFFNADEKPFQGSLDLYFGASDCKPGCSSSHLQYPQAINVGSDGNLYVSDMANDRIMVWENVASITKNGTVASFAVGQPDLKTCKSSPVSPTTLNQPYGLFYDNIDSHALVVADNGNNRVLVFCSNN